MNAWFISFVGVIFFMCLLIWRQPWRPRNPHYHKEWAKWRAWHPVVLVSGRRCWLEVVYRKDGRPLNDVIIWIYTDEAVTTKGENK